MQIHCSIVFFSVRHSVLTIIKTNIQYGKPCIINCIFNLPVWRFFNHIWFDTWDLETLWFQQFLIQYHLLFYVSDPKCPSPTMFRTQRRTPCNIKMPWLLNSLVANWMVQIWRVLISPAQIIAPENKSTRGLLSNRSTILMFWTLTYSSFRKPYITLLFWDPTHYCYAFSYIAQAGQAGQMLTVVVSYSIKTNNTDGNSSKVVKHKAQKASNKKPPPPPAAP